MEHRRFGQTGMQFSELGLGGCLERFEGICGHGSPEEKRRIYLRAAELGINLFDMGYGDEVHIPDELKGNQDGHYFALKAAGAGADTLEQEVDRHRANLRRDAIDVLRLHHHRFAAEPDLQECVARLRQAGKVRTLCTIRHHQVDQDTYVAQGPDPASDADLVIYNYVCRWQEAGMERSVAAGKGILIMKALGGQWLGWEDQVRADWEAGDEETVVQLAPRGEGIRGELDIVYPIVSGPWKGLAEPGEEIPPPERAVSWVLANRNVSSLLVAVASVAELEQIAGAAGAR